MALRAGVVDYRMGNLASVAKALERVGAESFVSDDAAELERADLVVLPGVGHFRAGMESLDHLGLAGFLRDWAGAGKPLIGICLGMQLLFSHSEEGDVEGLGIVGGKVVLLAPGVKCPQIGWNAVSWKRASPLVAGLPDPCPMYHVHTYAPRTGEVLGTATYGEEFVSAVEHDRVYGVQFHPEKSGPHGLRLLRNFARICAADGE
jgi:glutamine amidotransferase